jgi:hypothetical protein
LWDSWLRRDSLKAIGRTFGKPSLLFIAGWPPVLRRPVEITTTSDISRYGLMLCKMTGELGSDGAGHG